MAKKPSVKERKQRTDAKVENHPKREEIVERLLDWEPCDDIAVDLKDISGESVRRYLHRSGLFDKRLNNTEAVINCLIKRGMRSRLEVPPKVVVSALALRSKVRGEVQDSTNIQINNIPATSEFEKRMAQAEIVRGKPIRLTPIHLNGDQ